MRRALLLLALLAACDSTEPEPLQLGGYTFRLTAGGVTHEGILEVETASASNLTGRIILVSGASQGSTRAWWEYTPTTFSATYSDTGTFDGAPGGYHMSLSLASWVSTGNQPASRIGTVGHDIVLSGGSLSCWARQVVYNSTSGGQPLPPTFVPATCSVTR